MKKFKKRWCSRCMDSNSVHVTKKNGIVIKHLPWHFSVTRFPHFFKNHFPYFFNTFSILN